MQHTKLYTVQILRIFKNLHWLLIVIFVWHLAFEIFCCLSFTYLSLCWFWQMSIWEPKCNKTFIPAGANDGYLIPPGRPWTHDIVTASCKDRWASGGQSVRYCTEMGRSCWWSFLCTRSCQNDNFLCSQWGKFHWCDSGLISVSSLVLVTGFNMVWYCIQHSNEKAEYWWELTKHIL